MDRFIHKLNDSPQGGFKLANIHKLQELESGEYWPQLKPYFRQADYRNLRYSIQGRSSGKLAEDRVASVRGASRSGELDVAIVADHLAANLSITNSGIPDYCLTIVDKGNLIYSGEVKTPLSINEKVGLIYRGFPGTILAASEEHERLAIWFPHLSVTQRLSAMLDTPVSADVRFQPTINWSAPGGKAVRHLVDLLMSELQAPAPFILSSEVAKRSFTDLFIYTILKSLPHNYTDQVERPGLCATPGTLRRAEEYIRAHVEDPIALHDVAKAAGCSVRSLQLAFRNFRNSTPLLAIRHARLLAARDIVLTGDPWVTVAEIANQFGFANPSRFTNLYKSAFGESPVEVLRRRR